MAEDLRSNWQKIKDWSKSPPKASEIDENSEAGRIAREMEKRRKIEKEIMDSINQKASK